jgi:hypothetical protein
VRSADTISVQAVIEWRICTYCRRRRRASNETVGAGRQRDGFTNDDATSKAWRSKPARVLRRAIAALPYVRRAVSTTSGSWTVSAIPEFAEVKRMRTAFAPAG